MRLGIAVNVWDGEEHLQGALSQVRKFVDYIVAVTQIESNFGNEYGGGAAECLRLKFAGIIDEIITFEPTVSEGGAENEIKKRNLGIDACRRNQCTHYLLMDADEFYNSAQFSTSVRLIENLGYDTTACGIQTYFKKPTFNINPPEEYCVPFIQKLHSNSLVGRYKFSVTVDPTRAPSHSRNFYFFRHSELVLHHYSHLRKDYRRKLMNSSANVNWYDKIDTLVSQYESFKLGDEIPFFPNKTIREIPNYFNIREF